MINEKDGADEGWLVVRVRLGGRQEGRGEEGTWDPSLLIGHWITAVVKLHSAKNWNKRSKMSSFGTMRSMPTPKKILMMSYFQHFTALVNQGSYLKSESGLQLGHLQYENSHELWPLKCDPLQIVSLTFSSNMYVLLKKFLMRQHWTYLLWNSEYEFTRCKREWHGIGL